MHNDQVDKIYKVPKNQPQKQKSLNQYINETELKSLILRINNKTFKEHLSFYFEELNKILKDNSKQDEVVEVLSNIIKSKKYQLLKLPDEDLKTLKDNVENYNSSTNKNKLFRNILLIIEPLNNEMQEKIKDLNNNRVADFKRINKYINKHHKSKNQKFKRILRDHIINISERITIDKESHERFGELVLLIIKNILKKPKFSGYTYRDEFFSDSTDKIFRYMKNFNHKLISKITNQPVNAFSYISQYVHNSILFIINTNNAEQEATKNFINKYNNTGENLNVSSYESKQNTYNKHLNIESNIIKEISLELENIQTNDYTDIIFTYNNYKISLDEYKEILKIKENLKTTLSIIRKEI